jgi:DNA polymerase/3'-5' exonuclease PolX
MDLTTAQRYATRIVEWIGPFCARVAVAGSVRRGRPVCADIDIVCVPKVKEEKDLLGAASKRENLLLSFLQAYVRDRNPENAPGRTPHFIAGGEKEGKQVLVQLPKCQLDLWFAEEGNFGSRLVMRTGSKEHNIWLAQRALDMNGKWEPYEGVSINGVALPCPVEACVYAALGLELIEPANREMEWIHRHLEYGLKA